jgi:DinB superfamily
MDPRYPVGKFEWKSELSATERQRAIEEVEKTAAKFRAAVVGLNQKQLDTPYREGGWTVRQVVHHLADSHMHSYLRFKHALTEEQPAIKAYDEKLWAELADTRDTPVETSLALLESLHHRWGVLLRSMKPADFARAYRHPERGLVSLDTAVAMYAWHGRHHTAHVTALRERMGWK